MRNETSAKKISRGESPPLSKGFATQNAFPLPPLRYAHKKIMLLCNSQRTSAIDIFRIVNLDPVSMCLTMQLYSRFYRTAAKKYTDIEHIIIALSVNTVKNVILNTYETPFDVPPEKNDPKKDDFEEKFAAHSVATAVFAGILAKERNIKTSRLQEYRCAALLHDIGKLIAYKNLAYKADHCKAGVAVADEFELPQSLTDAITYHHSYNKYAGKNEDIVCNTILADFFANSLGYRCGKKENKTLQPKVLKTLNLTESTCKVLLEKIKPDSLEQFKNVQKFIKAGGT